VAPPGGYCLPVLKFMIILRVSGHDEEAVRPTKARGLNQRAYQRLKAKG